jgi:agmatine/peptidylarginine deiminase
MTFEEWRDKQGFPVNSTQERLWRECWETAQKQMIEIAAAVQQMARVEIKMSNNYGRNEQARLRELLEKNHAS